MNFEEQYCRHQAECKKICADMKTRGLSVNFIKIGELQAASIDVKDKFSTDCSLQDKIHYAVGVFLTLSEVYNIDLTTFLRYVMPNE